MPPRKPKSGAAGRAKRKQITQAAELNLDTAGAADDDLLSVLLSDVDSWYTICSQ